MDMEKLKQVSEKLKNYDWFLFAGGAIEVYTNGKRKSDNDFDIAVREENLDEIAKLFGTEAERRKIKKQNYISEDRGFVTFFHNQEIEITSGFPKKRRPEEDNTFNKLFENKKIVNYGGIDVPLVPIEELIVHKAEMFRDKDIPDLKLLLEKFKDNIKTEFVKELAEDIGKRDLIIKRLNEIGFNI